MAIAYSGMQINGSMEVSQELGEGARTTSGYVCDGWLVGANGGNNLLGHKQGEVTSLVPGIIGYLLVGNGTAVPSLGAANYLVVYQPIEGRRISRLAWGTSSAQPVTLGFWSSHFRTGLYSVAINNHNGTRSYVATYTQAASHVPQYNISHHPRRYDRTMGWR